MKKVLQITVYEADGEKGSYQTEIMIACPPVTLVGALCEVNYKINQSINDTDLLPKNAIWTMVCEMVGDRMLENSKK